MPKLSTPEIDRKNKMTVAYNRELMTRFSDELEDSPPFNEMEQAWEVDIEAYKCPNPFCRTLHEGVISLTVLKVETGEPFYALSLNADDGSTIVRINARQLTALIADAQELLRVMQ